MKIAPLIRRELDIEWKNETFGTDSKVVLGYINNSSKKFKLFVANQMQQIHEGSNVVNGDVLLTEYSRYMRAAM